MHVRTYVSVHAFVCTCACMYVALALMPSLVCLCLVPEVHLLHLDVAVYYYFVQLYTMYPCNFMDYLKARYGPKGELYIFKRHIAVSITLLQEHTLLQDVWY